MKFPRIRRSEGPCGFPQSGQHERGPKWLEICTGNLMILLGGKKSNLIYLGQVIKNLSGVGEARRPSQQELAHGSLARAAAEGFNMQLCQSWLHELFSSTSPRENTECIFRSLIHQKKEKPQKGAEAGGMVCKLRFSNTWSCFLWTGNG